MRTLLLALPLLAGCPPHVEETDDTDVAIDTDVLDTDDTDDTDDTEPQLTAVVVETDYTVGALATVALDGHVLTDPITPTSPDPGVVVDDGYLIVLDKFGYDVVKLYTPGSFAAPLVEIDVGDGANPHDAAICDGKLFVSRYEQASVGVYDLDGTPLGDVDLAEWADADGSPEPDTLAEADGRLFVSMNRLDRATDPYFWGSAGPGIVAEIDCATFDTVQSWEVGPNPSIEAVPGEPTHLVVRTGLYSNPDFSIALDGNLSRLDITATGAPQQFVTEDTLEGNVVTFAAGVERGLFVTQDAAGDCHVWCFDLATSNYLDMGVQPGFLIDVEVNDREEGWVAAAQSYPPASQTGLYVYDLSACIPLGGVIPTVLPPAAIGFY